MSDTKILVVDDDWFLASILERILVNAGYDVTLAANGGAALDLLATDQAFDTVLLDRMMPGIDGLQVLHRMKQTKALKDIPVVFQSAMDSEDEVLEGLKAGALYYLVKPLDPKLVLQVVAAAVGEYVARRQFWAEMEPVRKVRPRSPTPRIPGLDRWSS